MPPPLSDKRPGKGGQQYIFRGCTVIYADDPEEATRAVMVIMPDGLLVTISPTAATIARALSPVEAEKYLKSLPPSPFRDEALAEWEKAKEPAS